MRNIFKKLTTKKKSGGKETNSLPVSFEQLIFVTGFARGGTSWLRDCIATHPEIGKITGEIVFQQEILQGRDYAAEKIVNHMVEQQETRASKLYVSKAPANAPTIREACLGFPESKFIFIIRDPRDVFVSHRRGNQTWMRGKNSEIESCMSKIQRYYEGYSKAKDCDNIILVSYENLHQNFYREMTRILDFVGVESSQETLKLIFDKNNFSRVTGRRNVEDRNSAQRKGVIGDWGIFLSSDEMQWYQNNSFWKGFLDKHGYAEQPLYFQNILTAIKEAGANSLPEGDVIDLTLNADSLNCLLLFDIDFLKSETSRESVIQSAKILGKLDMAGIYNFLPMDDCRYEPLTPNKVIDIIHQIKDLAPKVAIGLHLNATEKFFPADMPDVGNDHPDISKAVAYLHRQVDSYEEYGIMMRFATSHGYGRGKKLPNNRDTSIFAKELRKRNILLFDTEIRSKLDAQATEVINFTDVGGALSVRRLMQYGALDQSETYNKIKPGGLIRLLNHPGNYDVLRPLVLSTRIY